MEVNTQTNPEKEAVWEGGRPHLMARLVGYDAANITQSDLSSITYTSRALSDLTTEIDGSALTITIVVFDTLQTDSRWSKDSTGYNFRHQLPAAAIPDGGVVYVIQYKFVDSSAAQFFLEFQLETRNQVFD